jgi:nicotinate-nucleotide pyrophosphorylase (carboxylating)
MRDYAFPDPREIAETIERALGEDGARADCTVAFLGAGDAVSARIVCRAPGVLAGLEVARMTFDRLDAGTRFDAAASDGDRVAPGDTVAEVHGRAGSVLSAERVALNFMQALSGVATLTARFVEKVRGSDIRILDTRKTTPLLRSLQRYAVRVGGGANHRFNLSDMILIKRNHLRSIGGIEAVRDRLGRRPQGTLIEIEVDTLDVLREILGWPVDRVMLDNFSPEQARVAVTVIRDFQKGHPAFAPRIELSGGVRLGNIDEYIIDGLHDISIGALTHSAPALDFSLEVTRRAD